jgi:hypothetical protein
MWTIGCVVAIVVFGWHGTLLSIDHLRCASGAAPI